MRGKAPNEPVRTISGVRIYDPRPASVVPMDDKERQRRHKKDKRRARNKVGRKSKIKNRGK